MPNLDQNNVLEESLDSKATSFPKSPLTQKLQRLYLLQDKLPKLIEDASVPTQELDKYYVKLNIIANEQSSSDKYPIEVEEIFLPKKDKPAADKVLFVGGAGVGKSAFLQNITYKWAKGGEHGLFNNKFDYVFKVKLKLLFSDWKAGYNIDDLDEPLKCFILYSLKSEPTYANLDSEHRIKKDEIFNVINTSNQDKILLLLDGYDEVASYISSGKDPIVTRMSEEIFKLKHVLMTSRPNALNSQMENKFDRKIETAGLGAEDIQIYVDKYFSKQQELLEERIVNLSAFLSSKGAKIDDKQALLEYFKNSSDNQEQEIYFQLDKIDKSRGLGSNIEEIKSAIRDSYQESKTLVSNLIITNANVREMAAIPINAAMLCLICSDHEAVEKFKGDFNIGQLYNEVILWLGKRYITKSGNEVQLQDTTEARILTTEELLVLKKVAHTTFQDNKLVIEGSIIDKIASDINKSFSIREVNKYGLLKVNNIANARTADDLINQEHEFIHLSFQEYLTAFALKELLLSDDQNIYKRATQFIGEHRNEPRYLVTIKFLAGLVTKGDENCSARQNQELVTRFWEAATCNIDGVLELGLNTKVTLLIHLLNQAKINGKLDNRIPNLDKLKELIDVVVTSDITSYADQIIASGYISPKIKEALSAILDLNFKWKIENAITIVEAEGSFAMVAADNLKRIEHNIEHDKETNTSLGEDELITQKNRTAAVHKTELQIALKMGVKLLIKDNKNNIEAQKFTNQILEILKNPNWQIKLEAINIFIELITNKNLVGFNLAKAEDIINIIQWHITDDNLKEEVGKLVIAIKNSIPEAEKNDFEIYLAKILGNQLQIFYKIKLIEEFVDTPSLPNILNQETIDELFGQISTTNWLQQYNAIILLGKAAKQNPELINSNIIDRLLAKLINNPVIDLALIETINSIMLHKSNVDVADKLKKMILNDQTLYFGKLVTKYFDLILIKKYEFDKVIINRIAQNLTLTHDQDSNGKVRSGAANALAETFKIKPDLLTENIVNQIAQNLSLTRDQDHDGHLREGAASALAETCKVRPDLLTQTLINQIAQSLSLTYDQDPYGHTRSAAARALAGTCKVRPDFLTETIVNQIAKNLSLTIDQDRCGEARRGAANALAETFKVRPDLLTVNIINQIAENLSLTNSQDGFGEARSGAASALAETFKVRPDLLTEIIVNQIAQNLTLTHDQDEFGRARLGATSALAEIAKVRPDFIETIVNKLAQILSQTHDRGGDEEARSGAANALAETFKVRPDLLTETIVNQITKNLILTRDQNYYGNGSSGAANALAETCKVRPDLLTETIVNQIAPNLSLPDSQDLYGKTRSRATSILAEIAKVRPDLTETIVNQIAQNLTLTHDQDRDGKASSGAASALTEIAKVRPDFTETIVNKLAKNLSLIDSQDRYGHLSSVTTSALVETAKVRPDLLTETIVNQIAQSLSLTIDQDPYGKARSAAANALAETFKVRPDLLTQTLINQIAQNLSLTIDQDRSGEVRRGSANALAETCKVRPDFIETIINKLSQSLSLTQAQDYIVNQLAQNLSLTKDQDPYGQARSAAANALAELFKVRPDLLTVNIVNKLAVNLSLTGDQDRHGQVGRGAASALAEIAKVRPDFTETIVNQIAKNLTRTDAQDRGGYARSGAASALAEIAKVRPDFTETIVNRIAQNLSLTQDQDEDGEARSGAASALAEIAKIRHDLTETILSQIAENLSLTQYQDMGGEVRRGAVSALAELFKVRPDLLTETIVNRIAENLSLTKDQDTNGYVRSGAANALAEIFKVRPDLLTETIVNKLGQNLTLTRDQDHDGGARSAAANALAETFKVRPDLLTQTLINQIAQNLSLTKDQYFFQGAREGAASALAEIAKVRPDFLTETIVNQIAENLSLTKDQDPCAKARPYAASALAEIAKVRPDLLTQTLLNQIAQNLTLTDFPDWYGNARLYAASALAEIAKVRPDLTETIVNQIAENISLTRVQDRNGDARLYAASALAELFKVRPELVTEIVVNKLVQNLILYDFNDSYGKVIDGVASALAETLKVRPDLLTETIVNQIAENLSLTQDQDWNGKARSGAASALAEIANIIKPTLIDNVITSLIDALPNADTQLNPILISALKSVTTACPSIAIKYLDHPVKEVREAITETLILVLSNQEQALKIPIETLLSMVAFYNQNDKEKKALIESAKKALNQKVTNLNPNSTEQYKEEIKYITKNYDKFLALSGEAPKFLSNVYIKVLSDNRITSVEKDFIITVLKHGLATSFAEPNKIIYDGSIYEFQDEASQINLQEIIRVSLERKNDLLINQYIKHQPVFANINKNLKMAANDIPEVNSITSSAGGTGVVLLDDKYLLSILDLKNDNETTNSDNKLILLETRNSFGNVLIYKILLSSSSIEINQVNLHPDELTERLSFANPSLKALLELPDEYASYAVESTFISFEQQEKIFEKLKSQNAESVSSIEAFVHEVLDYDMVSLPGAIHSNVAGYDLLAMVPDQAMIKLANHDLLLIDHEGRITRNEEELAHLAKKLDLTQEQMSSMTRDIEQLGVNKEDMDKVLSLLDNMSTLESVISNKKLDDQEKAVLEAILQDPYKASFYNSLRWELNATYLAAMTVQTEIVQNSKTGVVGNIGSILQTASNYVPMVGPGVLFFGAVLNLVDKAQQEKMVGNYARLAASSEEMDQIAKTIAIGIIASGGLDRAKIDRPETILSKCCNILAKGLDMIAGSAGDVSASGAVGAMTQIATNIVTSEAEARMADTITNIDSTQSASFSDRFSSFFTKQGGASIETREAKEVNKNSKSSVTIEEQTKHSQVELGKSDATTIAQIIISRVYSGVIKPTDTMNDDAAESILSFIQTEYGIETAQQENAITAPIKDLPVVIPSSINLKSVNKSKIVPFIEEPDQSTAQVIEATVVAEHRSIQERLAFDIVSRLKTLIDADDLSSQNLKREKTFIIDLADSLNDHHSDWLSKASNDDAFARKMVKEIAKSLYDKKIASVRENQIVLSNEFVTEDDFFLHILNNTNVVINPSAKVVPVASDSAVHQDPSTNHASKAQKEKSSGCVIFSMIEARYENPFLNETALLSEAVKCGIGAEGINSLIDLGQDQELAKELIEASEEYGPKYVIDMLFGSSEVTNYSVYLHDTESEIIATHIAENDHFINLAGET